MDGEYIDRKYRKSFAAGRWHGFSVCYKETDLWIGIDRASWNEDIPSFASSYVQSLRHEMDSWIASHAEYAASLVPVECTDDAPLIFRQMAEVAFHSGIGPMSAVAGAVAAFTGRAIKERFGVVEVLVENGGDIYADIATDMDVSVFAGRSPLSEHQNNLYKQSIYQQLYLQFYFTPFVFIPTCTATMTSSSLSGPVQMFSYSHTKIIK